MESTVLSLPWNISFNSHISLMRWLHWGMKAPGPGTETGGAGAGLMDSGHRTPEGTQSTPHTIQCPYPNITFLLDDIRQCFYNFFNEIVTTISVVTNCHHTKKLQWLLTIFPMLYFSSLWLTYNWKFVPPYSLYRLCYALYPPPLWQPPVCSLCFWVYFWCSNLLIIEMDFKVRRNKGPSKGRSASFL